MESVFEEPTMLEHLDFLFKDDMARRLLFYHQVRIKGNHSPVFETF
jgi:hypothetical protein